MHRSIIMSVFIFFSTNPSRFRPHCARTPKFSLVKFVQEQLSVRQGPVNWRCSLYNVTPVGVWRCKILSCCMFNVSPPDRCRSSIQSKFPLFPGDALTLVSTGERLPSALADRRLRCKIAIFTCNFVVFPTESTNETGSAFWKVLISALNGGWKQVSCRPLAKNMGNLWKII